jgi:hypothetical protein
MAEPGVPIDGNPLRQTNRNGQHPWRVENPLRQADRNEPPVQRNWLQYLFGFSPAETNNPLRTTVRGHLDGVPPPVDWRRPEWLQPDPPGTYRGFILPFTSSDGRGLLGSQGERNLAIPGLARDFLGGLWDLGQGPRTGAISGDALMSLMDVSGAGVASRAARPMAGAASTVGALGAGPGRGAGRQAATEVAPTFYSQLTRSMEGVQRKSGTAQQWQAELRKSGAKKAEIEWSGVNEWLADQKGPVSREQVVNFLRRNEIKVEEVVLGSPNYRYRTVDEYQNAINEAERGGDFKLAEDLTLEQEALGGVPPGGGAAHSDPKLQLPGGENYRELMLTMPVPELGAAFARRLAEVAEVHGRVDDPDNFVDYATPTEIKELRSLGRYGGELSTEEVFTRGHAGDPPNTVVRVRFNERDVDGQRVLFLEEVQSDWGQAGRREGFGDEVPDMPFKDLLSAELVMKRMIRWAAENDFDRIAWTTGKQQADRYSLVRQVDEVKATQQRGVGAAEFLDEGDGTWRAVGPDNQNWGVYESKADAIAAVTASHPDLPSGVWRLEVSTSHGPKNVIVQESELAERIGEDLAKRIIDEGGGTYSGLDLEIGGEWAQRLYDESLVNFARKYGKKWGAEVGSGLEINEGGWGMVNSRGTQVGDDVWNTADDAAIALRQSGMEASNTVAWIPADTVHYMTITPEMRGDVLGQGQRLMSGGVPVVPYHHDRDSEKPVNPLRDINTMAW